MEFARKQLEKYGWTDGKGLGKNENGISQALKPKLKRSVAGIGYDAASDFTEHWWSALYDKAAKNVEVEEKNGKTKKIKRKDNDEFEITNSTWKIHKKKKKKDDVPVEAEYLDFFVRTDAITRGKVKTKKVGNDSDNEEKPYNHMKLTDEQLFAACEGRTAHKGARHGLKALGKLARIEQQEQMLLKQARFKGYSHAKSLDSNDDTQVFEESNMNTNCDLAVATKKKKKKKRCNSYTRNMNNMEVQENNVDNAEVVQKVEESTKKRNSNLEESKIEKKSQDHKLECSIDRGKHEDVNEEKAINSNIIEGEDNLKLKKKKRKHIVESEENEKITIDSYQNVSKSKKRK